VVALAQVIGLVQWSIDAQSGQLSAGPLSSR
jgi:hypothetical protein